MSDLVQQQTAFTHALRNGDEAAAQTLVEVAQAAGTDLATIYFELFAPSMVTIGTLWEQNELSVAEEHLATAITERLIGQLSPGFTQSALQGTRGNAVLGCVEGERHALGLRMLSDLFRQQGWHVLYLGADVPRADWVRLAVRFNASLVAISAGAQRHAPALRALVQELRAVLPQLTILVGGAAFRQEPDLWQQIGADLYHPHALTAVALASARHMRDPALQAVALPRTDQ